MANHAKQSQMQPRPRHLRHRLDPYATAAIPRATQKSSTSSRFSVITSLGAFVCVAYWLIAIGFVLCCLPPTTLLFSTLFSDAADSPYSHSQLTELAQATRAYTVEGTSEDDLYAAIGEKGKNLASPTVRIETGKSLDLSSMDDADAGRLLAEYTDTLSHQADAIEHLDQVHTVIVWAGIILLITLAVGIPCIASLLKGSRRGLGRALLAAGVVVLVAFCAFALGASADFDAFFALFHSLFFADGTWTFSADSLLICQYPENFWIAMGIVWGAATVIASLVAITIGYRTRRNA